MVQLEFVECVRVCNCELIHLLYNGSCKSIMITATETLWWWHVWCAETCRRIDEVWRIYL